jgi:hypothetical protein
MDTQHLSALLDLAGTTEDGPFKHLKDERTLTLHAAKGGVSLNVGKVCKVRTEGKLLFAENVVGETFVLELESVFAGSVAPSGKESRKAGFR